MLIVFSPKNVLMMNFRCRSCSRTRCPLLLFQCLMNETWDDLKLKLRLVAAGVEVESSQWAKKMKWKFSHRKFTGKCNRLYWKWKSLKIFIFHALPCNHTTVAQWSFHFIHLKCVWPKIFNPSRRKLLSSSFFN